MAAPSRRRSESRAGKRAASSGARPGRCSRSGRRRPSPQATVRRRRARSPARAPRRPGKVDGGEHPHSSPRRAASLEIGARPRVERAHLPLQRGRSRQAPIEPAFLAADLPRIGDAVLRLRPGHERAVGDAVERLEHQPAAERGERGRRARPRLRRERSASPAAAGSGRCRAPPPSA